LWAHGIAPVWFAGHAYLSNAKTFFQSLFISTTIQPRLGASFDASGPAGSRRHKLQLILAKSDAMTPEEKARREIDRQLGLCGWIVQDRREMDISAGPGVAIREFPLPVGEADYLLYLDGKAAGIIEAKPEGYTLTGVETQSAKYVNALPEGVPSHRLPLPFCYESTGKETQFTNLLDPDARSRLVFTFHRPEELGRIVGLEKQLRARLRELPPPNAEGLWEIKKKAIGNLEASLAVKKPRSLTQMATGAGKTLTAVVALYRLIRFAGAKRILFLVDRTNLGKQTFAEFQLYVSPYNGLRFTGEYNVQHLRTNTIDPVCKVCITTIQRLYSMLKGEDEFDEGNEDRSMFEAAAQLIRQPVPVDYNPRIPIETFDFIITDECHRSIYNLWRQVLEYFDAFLIGLTATPTKQPIGFFNNNLVMEYGHEQAVADGVNVGFDVYRIRTKITEQGAKLEQELGRYIPHRDKRTRARRYAELDDDVTYTANQLDRDVVAEDQIRLVIRTFRDRLFTEIFPGRKEVPKTLVFAKDDSHAEDITRIFREEFGAGNDFCQKITYKLTIQISPVTRCHPKRRLPQQYFLPAPPHTVPGPTSTAGPQDLRTIGVSGALPKMTLAAARNRRAALYPPKERTDASTVAVEAPIATSPPHCYGADGGMDDGGGCRPHRRFHAPALRVQHASRPDGPGRLRPPPGDRRRLLRRGRLGRVHDRQTGDGPDSLGRRHRGGGIVVRGLRQRLAGAARSPLDPDQGRARIPRRPADSGGHEPRPVLVRGRVPSLDPPLPPGRPPRGVHPVRGRVARRDVEGHQRAVGARVGRPRVLQDRRFRSDLPPLGFAYALRR
jgi:superfamily II DNA or RNA helicase